MELTRVLEKVKEVAQVNKDKELAEVFGISRSDFANRKARGTLLALVIDWAETNNIDFAWLFRKDDNGTSKTIDAFNHYFVTLLEKGKGKEVSLDREEFLTILILRQLPSEARQMHFETIFDDYRARFNMPHHGQ